MTPFRTNRAARRHLRRNAGRFVDEVISKRLVAGNGSVISDPEVLAIMRRAMVAVLKHDGLPVFVEITAGAESFALKASDLPATLAVAIDAEGRFAWTCRPGRDRARVAVELAALCVMPGHPALWGGVAGHA